MSAPLRVFVAGEGKDDIGDARAGTHGVVQTLLLAVDADAWDFAGHLTWKSIHKYRAGEHRSAEVRNVLGLQLAAKEAGAQVIAFVRDRDGVAQRQQDIEAGIRQMEEAGQFRVIGGVAVEAIEAWVLACCDDHKAEKHKAPKEVLAEKHGIDTCVQKVERVQGSDLAKLPRTATSLKAWLARAEQVAGSRTA